MPAPRVLVFLLGLLLLGGGLCASAYRIVVLERDELEHESPWQSLASSSGKAGSTRFSARLTEVALKPGEEAVFELCAQAPLSDPMWKGALDLAVWEPATQKLELKVPLDAEHLAHVKERAGKSCLTLGSGRIQRAGTYVLDAVWAGKATPSEALRSVLLKARVLARRPLAQTEAVLVLCSALGALLSVFSGFAAHPGEPALRRATAVWALAGSALAAALTWMLLHLPVPGAIGGFARGMALSVVQLAIAVVGALLLYATPRAGLALHAPARRAGPWLFAAIGAALVLRPIALSAMRLVPATGEAPIEAFISWPSGALAFAALGMAVPLAEELFFRGFIYGALAPLGTGLALGLTTLLFAAVHAPQTWGNWGALLSVTVTGAVLTGLRALSGSTLVPAVAHLLYNLSLWTDSFRG